MIGLGAKGILRAGVVFTVHSMFTLEPDRQLFFDESCMVTGAGCDPLNRCSGGLTSL